MCGLTGFVTANPGRWQYSPRGVIGGMTRTLRHRGPDDSGTFIDFDAGVALGHTRLAIIDLSSSGAQPMQSRSTRFVLAFNGEIYNFLELRGQLEAIGCRFKGHSDTEVLLEAIEAWGLTETLTRANGMFAIALWDRRHRRLVLAKDRMGEKPLYYGWTSTGFVFGSELKAVAAHPDFAGQLDRGALCSYLRYAYVPTPWSIYKGIYKLPAGTWLEVDGADAMKRGSPQAYWSLVDVALSSRNRAESISDRDAVEQLEALLADSVNKRVVADVPVGAFLSGGIDSSIVVALMQAASGTPVRTFTIGSAEASFDETEPAREVARYLGTDHTEVMVGAPEIESVIPSLPRIFDEPLADPVQIPTFLLSRMARSQVTVALSGEGGDELFGGYHRHMYAPGVWNSVSRIPGPARSLLARAILRVPPSRLDLAYSRLEPSLPRRLRQSHVGDRLHNLASALTAPDAAGYYRLLASQWPQPTAAVVDGFEPNVLLDEVLQRSGPLSFAAQMMLGDQLSYIPDMNLARVDRASMAVSLEVRVPLLDHRVVEFSWNIPDTMKVRNGQGKWVLRQVLDKHLPRELIERPKMGFAVDVGTWLRGPLRPWAEDLLGSASLRRGGVFDADIVRSRWMEHLDGRRNWTRALWAILMFQGWAEHLPSHGPSRPATGTDDLSHEV